MQYNLFTLAEASKQGLESKDTMYQIIRSTVTVLLCFKDLNIMQHLLIITKTKLT